MFFCPLFRRQLSRTSLPKYAEDNGFTPYEFIYDDGYSGADFDRPAFAQMIEEVEAGTVGLVIVKDMSRFGRDYLKVGFYTEILFSEKDVRLIAVNDNVDTGRGENDFTPMMNLFNEWFVKNTSKKIRAVWQAKGKSGERLAVIPPYGYRKDPDNPKQLVFEDTHPAIIAPETWDIVRSMRQHKRRSPRYGNPGLFSGVAYCSDCGSKLYFHTRSIKNKWETRYEGSYSCSEYRKDVQYREGRKCTCHFIRESQLEQLVLEELRDLLRYIPKHEKQFTRVVMDRSAQEYKRETAAKKRTAEKHRRRIAELDTLIERLYVDNVSGKIADERYEKMSAKFETEQAELVKTVDALETEIAAEESQSVNVDRFLSVVRRYTVIEELTPAIIHEFIDRIIVHEPEQARGNRRQKIEIIYNNVGAVDRLTLKGLGA